jgi:hypothetical protein
LLEVNEIVTLAIKRERKDLKHFFFLFSVLFPLQIWHRHFPVLTNVRLQCKSKLKLVKSRQVRK